MGDELVPAAWGRRRVPVPTSAQPRCPDVIATVTQGFVSPPCFLGLFWSVRFPRTERSSRSRRPGLALGVCPDPVVACKCLVPGTETLPRGLGEGVRPRGRGASAWPAGSADDARMGGRWGRSPGKLEARVVKETQTVTTGHGGSARGRRGPREAAGATVRAGASVCPLGSDQDRGELASGAGQAGAADRAGEATRRAPPGRVGARTAAPGRAEVGAGGLPLRGRSH